MSEAPLAARLQVKGARRLAVVGAPDVMDAAIGADDARAEAAQADVVLLFVRDRAGLDAGLHALLPRLRTMRSCGWPI
jgi:hypothetical protein